jgi:hypothetical protein
MRRENILLFTRNLQKFPVPQKSALFQGVNVHGMTFFPLEKV